jgi:hypothetical protein
MGPLAVVLLSGALNRFRGWGKPKGFGAVKKLLYGAFMGGVFWCWFGMPTLLIPLLAVAFAIGSAPGWGYQMGIALGGEPNPKGPEKWQVGKLADPKYTHLALGVRGIMWGAVPAIAVAFFWTSPALLLLPLAFGVALALSPVVITQAKIKFWDRWWTNEVLTGFIAGLIIAIGAYV